MSDGLVSIIIPCYNGGQTIDEAISSALAQTYPSVEVIVVDDGSTDNSASRVKKYHDVHLIIQKNSGVVAAKNCGASQANGDYLLFLDCDDILKRNAVELMLQCMADDTAFVYSDMEFFGARHGKVIARPLAGINRQVELVENFIGNSSLIRKLAFEAIGGYDDKLGRLCWEDWDLWLNLIHHNYKGRYVAEPLLLYRQHRQKGASRNSLDGHAIIKARAASSIIRQKYHKQYQNPLALIIRLLYKIHKRLMPLSLFQIVCAEDTMSSNAGH